MKKISTLGLLFFILVNSGASAHYMWIETSAEWKSFTPNKIDVYYGEYENSQKEKIDGRFSEMKGFNVSVTDPLGKKHQLDLTPAGDHYTTTFTPIKLAGTYIVELENTSREVLDWTKYDIGIIKPEYFATAIAKVTLPPTEKPDVFPAANEPVLNHNLNIIPVDTNRNKINRALAFTVKKNEASIPGQKLMVHSPNGWSKELEPDAKGNYHFTPLWEGQYVMEAVYNDKNPGNFLGKDYPVIRQRATYSFRIKK
jgi:uncharacterized GH25 family protein